MRTLKKSWKVTLVMLLKLSIGLFFYVVFIFTIPDSDWKHDVTNLALLSYTVFIMASAIDAMVHGE